MGESENWFTYKYFLTMPDLKFLTKVLEIICFNIQNLRPYIKLV
jgi:hypothetical protein